ncbi:MAG: hypothetical protein LVQ95_01195 [Candidatus Micrarchaeales archaeon]|nr:hypothetical protein [Candidatus Micrarchaeales archaeon]
MDDIKTPVIDRELKKRIRSAKLAYAKVKTAKTAKERVDLMLKAARKAKEIDRFIRDTYELWTYKR